jgi:hypothetical protein
LLSAERRQRARINVMAKILNDSRQIISKSSKPNPQSSIIDDALIITDDNGRIVVGDDVVMDVNGDDETGCGG